MLFDCGWHREMSPRGVFDRRAQIGSLGSLPLYLTNQGLVGRGEAIDEQLAALGIAPEDLDLVLLSHLDCDHANGLSLVAGAKKLLVSEEELCFAENGSPVNRIRYCAKWWRGTKLAAFRWNGSDGPAGKSYDVFGDGSLVMVNIPGHAKGQCALKVTGRDGRFVLLYADGGYAKKSWEDLVLSGIADDRTEQKRSLRWIREQSLDKNCVASLANHDPAVRPHTIVL